MAIEFDSDFVFKMAADYIRRGYKVVRLHWPNADGTCSCGEALHSRGEKQEKQRGKHPFYKSWQKNACDDEEVVSDWVNAGRPFNIGVQLGPRSGIIDVEWDNERAKQFAEEMGLTEIETPTFISGRSEHRIFLWDSAMESLTAGVVKPSGLEVRTGAGDSGIQSVFPPSMHWSGVQYRWKDGFGLDDVPVQPLPDHFLRMIVNLGDDAGAKAGGESSESTKHNRGLLHSGAGEGERHDFVKNVSCRLVFNEKHAYSQKIQADLVRMVDCINRDVCKPPLDISEVASLVSWACDRKRKMTETGVAIPSTPEEVETFVSTPEEDERDVSPVSRGWALHGLAWSETTVKEGDKATTVSEWMPGNWKIQMIESDPPEIVLIVPNWSKLPGGGKITMPLADYLDARAVAKRIFETTRRIIVDADTKEWHAIWRGLPAKGTGDKRRPRVDGLAVKLMANKKREDDVEVGASSLRYAVVAGWLLEAFKRATKPRNEETPEPNESGRPCWVKPEEMWFKWAKTWEEIERMHILNAGERAKMRRIICDEVGAEDLHEIRYLFGGVRHAYVVFDSRWISAVERLAAGRKLDEEIPV
jgi:hypothetical protein